MSIMPMIGQLSDNVLTNCLIFGQCSVQEFNGWFMLCSTVRWLLRWVSKSPIVRLGFSSYPMVRQSCVQLSKGWIMLCQTVQWLESGVSNSPMVSQCWVKLSDGWLTECSTFKWLDCALSNRPMVDSAVRNSPIVKQCCSGSPMVERRGVLLFSGSMVGQCCVQETINSFTIKF